MFQSNLVQQPAQNTRRTQTANQVYKETCIREMPIPVQRQNNAQKTSVAESRDATYAAVVAPLPVSSIQLRSFH